MGFIKIKNNHILWPIALHTINNSIAIGIMIVGKNVISS